MCKIASLDDLVFMWLWFSSIILLYLMKNVMKWNVITEHALYVISNLQPRSVITGKNLDVSLAH